MPSTVSDGPNMIDYTNSSSPESTPLTGDMSNYKPPFSPDELKFILSQDEEVWDLPKPDVSTANVESTQPTETNPTSSSPSAAPPTVDLSSIPEPSLDTATRTSLGYEFPRPTDTSDIYMVFKSHPRLIGNPLNIIPEQARSLGEEPFLQSGYIPTQGNNFAHVKLDDETYNDGRGRAVTVEDIFGWKVLT